MVELHTHAFQARRKSRKTPMSDPVARYAAHKQAWKRNIFLTQGSHRRPYKSPVASVRRNADLAQPYSSADGGFGEDTVVGSGATGTGRATSRTSMAVSPSAPAHHHSRGSGGGIRKAKQYVVPTNKRRDGVRGDIRTKMRMVRLMEAQAGKRGGNRGASRAKTPSTFRVPSSKKRQALRWDIRAKMLSPA